MLVSLAPGLLWLHSAAAERTDDRDLVARAKEGEVAACRALYRCHGPAIRRFLRDMLRDHALADDALQETFARAFARLDTLEDPSRLAGWLFAVARFVSLELRKERARRARNVVSGESFDDPPSALTPEREVLGREAATLVARALEQLSEERRAALLLRVDHGLSYPEIAQILEWSVAKAKVEVHRARTVLRSVLAAEEDQT
jgi:RNA polymerase sigma-70 factor (ECF subfamily)